MGGRRRRRRRPCVLGGGSGVRAGTGRGTRNVPVPGLDGIPHPVLRPQEGSSSHAGLRLPRGPTPTPAEIGPRRRRGILHGLRAEAGLAPTPTPVGTWSRTGPGSSGAGAGAASASAAPHLLLLLLLTPSPPPSSRCRLALPGLRGSGGRRRRRRRHRRRRGGQGLDRDRDRVGVRERERLEGIDVPSFPPRRPPLLRWSWPAPGGRPGSQGHPSRAGEGNRMGVVPPPPRRGGRVEGTRGTGTVGRDNAYNTYMPRAAGRREALLALPS